MSNLTMADLLAKKESKFKSITRGQEIEGIVLAVLQQEIILDLSSKSEGVLPKKDLISKQLESLKVGDKITCFVIHPENESGQVVLGMFKVSPQLRSTKGSRQSYPRLDKFQEYLSTKKTLVGKGIEVNRGGLIVEVNGVRGFLPSSQVSLSQASNLEDLIDKELSVVVVEVDPAQNKLIFSQKQNISDTLKKDLERLKIGDVVKGSVAAVLPFGIFVSLDNGIEGLVHVSEVSWEKVEDLIHLYKVGDEVSTEVISIEPESFRVNLSIKKLTKDPFTAASEKFLPDDVIKGVVSKITSSGVFVSLEDGIEGIIPSSKVEDIVYKEGDKVTVLIDSIDNQKRRINLAPFLTSTKDLIYK